MLALIFLLLLIIIQIISYKINNKKYKFILSKISGYISVLYILIFIFFILSDIFRYKEYRKSEFHYVVKNNNEKYIFDTDMYLIKDRLTGEIYIKLIDRYKNRFSFFSGRDLENLILLDNGNYIIDKDSKVRFHETYLYLIQDDNCGTLFWKKDKKQCKITIEYKGKKLALVSSSQKIDSQLKDLDYQYGFSFEKLKKLFDLSLVIEIDDKNKIVYFIENEK